MKKYAFLFLLLAACSESNPVTHESEVTSRRNRLERLASVDALARLYVGHELPRRDLVELEAQSERGVVDALVRRPDFQTRYSARLAQFGSTNGDPPASNDVDPDRPLVDTLDEKKADRFARWLVETQAPLAAKEVLSKNEENLARMTYRELLDTIRKTSARRPR